jgi:hypothetical protein
MDQFHKMLKLFDIGQEVQTHKMLKLFDIGREVQTHKVKPLAPLFRLVACNGHKSWLEWFE